VIKPVHLDLRNPAHAKRLEAFLAGVDLQKLEAKLREQPKGPGKKSVTLLGLDATDSEIQEALDQVYGKKK
jgi:hypothetical protein